MLFSLVGLVVAVVLVFVLFWYSESGYQGRHMLAGLTGVLLGVKSAGSVVLYIFLAWEYKAAEYKVGILNREYGTAYTAQEVFYAKDVIDAIRNLDRQRVEVNGNIFKK